MDKLVLSGYADTYSLNESGCIFISTYLPERSVASSPDKRNALEPVIYRSTFFLHRSSQHFAENSLPAEPRQEIRNFFLFDQFSLNVFV